VQLHDLPLSNVFSAGQPQTTSSAELMAMRTEMRGDLDSRARVSSCGSMARSGMSCSTTSSPRPRWPTARSTAIYFVPLTVIGGRRVTYMEYVNYDMTGGFMDGARAFARRQLLHDRRRAVRVAQEATGELLCAGAGQVRATADAAHAHARGAYHQRGVHATGARARLEHERLLLRERRQDRPARLWAFVLL
jgi:hypothetical protein